MIKLKEQAIKDIDELNSIEVAKIYELIRYFKDSKKRITEPNSSYLQVRDALQFCDSSFSDDILTAREETA
jgi:hypothetical protein